MLKKNSDPKFLNESTDALGNTAVHLAAQYGSCVYPPLPFALSSYALAALLPDLYVTARRPPRQLGGVDEGLGGSEELEEWNVRDVWTVR